MLLIIEKKTMTEVSSFGRHNKELQEKTYNSVYFWAENYFNK